MAARLPERITVAYLKKGACSRSITIFRRTFGASAVINLENLRKAHEAGLSLFKLFDYLYDGDKDNRLHDKYCPACGGSLEAFYRKYQRDLKAQAALKARKVAV